MARAKVVGTRKKKDLIVCERELESRRRVSTVWSRNKEELAISCYLIMYKQF